MQIAKRHLLPKELKRHGLAPDRSCRSPMAPSGRSSPAYTRESGVRVLEREMAALCRKAAMKLVAGSMQVVFPLTERRPGGTIWERRRYHPEKLEALAQRVGVVNGLAWTSVGGELLEVEVNVVPGTGKVELTGNLGDVMKESGPRGPQLYPQPGLSAGH